ncbi:MAG: M23 family metallopeptidase [Dethiobacteria bacterium]|jgi:murein DD-endopeptidase MepM/ murein hydrolase activator NlpD|nr:M23 family metallopeptidase [Bacillota bacterium]NMD33140.1 M23 family metallopeptidase [Bacillota bacterium]HOB28877.1 M23 family metallopeptidase [Bacillota bacterium]HPZ41631.1 M23 family metallopeptidase [Bacillota bacterium]HQD51616.1 M23 family metallopeptidase [Bacillota bacterium]
MSYRRRSAPVSTLRVKLQQHLTEKNSWNDNGELMTDELPKTKRPFFLFGALKTMHRYFLVKLTVAVMLVLLVALLIKGGYTWGEPLLQGLRFVVEWDLDPGAFSEKTGPAFRLLFDRLELPVIKPLVVKPGQPILPVDGVLKSGFGLRMDSKAGREQMHYGIDLAAPEGSVVRALLEGRVEQVISGKDGSVTVVIACEPDWTMIYRGIVAAGVKEGETIAQGAQLGSLGRPQCYELPHLHFELRSGGRPVAPPADWTARFTASAERT